MGINDSSMHNRESKKFPHTLKTVQLYQWIHQSLQEQQTNLENEITEKNKTQSELLRTVKEKDILLKEIHHRVKNNLAVVSGLIELQNFYIKDEKAAAILKSNI